MEINTICICGAGTMGSGIAQVCAQAGFSTILYDLNTKILDRAKILIEKNLQTAVEKGKLTTEQKSAIQNRIRFSDDLQDCRAGLFIEAIIEKTEAKINLFNQLAELNDSNCIFATNTSSLSIGEIAKGIKNPERVIGLHFFNPAPLMKLVEIISSEYTKDDITVKMTALIRSMGKTPVVCRDSPGFIVNRVARPFYLEALRLVEEKQTDFQQADRLLEACGFRMGPFRLMDLIGNDVNYAVSCSVFEQMNRPERLQPSSIQKDKVEKRELGRKTGTGYYVYDKKS